MRSPPLSLAHCCVHESAAAQPCALGRVHRAARSVRDGGPGRRSKPGQCGGAPKEEQFVGPDRGGETTYQRMRDGHQVTGQGTRPVGARSAPSMSGQSCVLAISATHVPPRVRLALTITLLVDRSLVSLCTLDSLRTPRRYTVPRAPPRARRRGAPRAPTASWSTRN